MDDQTGWLRAAADILNAADPAVARARLVAELQAQTRAGLVTRVQFSPHDPEFLEMGVDGYLPYPPKELWPGAAVMRVHPINRFHADTLERAPVLLADVAAAGWAPDPDIRDYMIELGIPEHQLSIPTGPSPAAYDGWVLIGEEAFDEDAAERVAPFQELITGLGLHICLLERSRAAQDQAPCPDAVALTPREQVILCLVAHGHTVVGMAQRLGISPRTVHKHQENLYRKLGAVDRLSAVLAAQRLGILPQVPEPLNPLPPRSVG